MKPEVLEALICETLAEAVKPKSGDTFAERAERLISFNEPGRTGSFSLHQREYVREPLNCYGIDQVTDLVLCWGTRTAKTTVMYTGTALRALEKARRILFVKPTSHGTDGSRSNARTRFIPMCRASSDINRLIPSGALRHNFTIPQQMFLNGSIIDWTGSNSVSNLAGNSMEDVNQDEIDKFNVTRRRNEEGNEIEADATDLADERTAEFKYPKRVKASTPTLPTGRIWRELLQTDLRRRFIPCPLCGRDHPSSRLMAIAWSESFTILPKTFGFGTSREPNSPIPLGYIQWDPEAKRENGWDLDRVERSAGILCPHCHGRFKDDEVFKTWMDRNGLWEPTKAGAPRTHGYHLPSMYSSHEQTNAGKLALNFLEDFHSLKGPRNFINSKLAEAYAEQGSQAERVDLVSTIEVGSEWRQLMSVDCQQKSPHFWFVRRAYGAKEIVGLKCGSADTWDDVRAAQGDHVRDAAVIIDSGYGARDDAEVYRTCAQYGELIQDNVRRKLLHIGWMPAKGMPGRRRWRDPETGLSVPWYYRPIDPFMGTDRAGEVSMDLFEFAADHFKDILSRLRDNKDPRYVWAIADPMDTDEYHEHMRNHIKKAVLKYGQIVVQYMRRHRDAPDHLYACEVMQVAGAFSYKLLTIQEERPVSKLPTGEQSQSS